MKALGTRLLEISLKGLIVKEYIFFHKKILMLLKKYFQVPRGMMNAPISI